VPGDLTLSLCANEQGVWASALEALGKEKEHGLRALRLDEPGSDGAQLDVHRSSTEGGTRSPSADTRFAVGAEAPGRQR
jgi:hypothetical protein